MSKQPTKKPKPARKPKPLEPQVDVGDDGCWELPPKKKRKRRDKSRSGT